MASAGRYRVGQRIGQGGMAEVFRVEVATASAPGAAARFERPLVLKRVRRELARLPEVAAMFAAEAQLAQRLQHGGIVQVLDAGVDDDGAPFLVMELIDGVSLDGLLAHLGARRERLPVAEALRVVGELAEALAYAHRLADDGGAPLGLVHRDVTPRNVLLSREGVVKLADFGIARVGRPGAGGGAGTLPGLVKGSVGYLSPEQARGEAVDARSDQFSLGVVLHELLAGTNPLADAAGLDEAQALLARGLPPLAEAPPIDAALAAIVARATAARPGERFADIDALAHALEEWRVTRKQRGAAERLAALVRQARGEPAAAPVRALDAALGGDGGGGGGRGDEDPARQATVALGARDPRPPRRALLGAAGATVLVLGTVAALVIATGGAMPGKSGAADAAAAIAADAGTDAGAATATATDAGAATATATDAGAATATASPRPLRPSRSDAGPSAPSARGRLRVNVLPWALVQFDGQRLGQTPVDVTWPEGTYVLVLENPDSGRRGERKVTIRAGAPVEITSW